MAAQNISQKIKSKEKILKEPKILRKLAFPLLSFKISFSNGFLSPLFLSLKWRQKISWKTLEKMLPFVLNPSIYICLYKNPKIQPKKSKKQFFSSYFAAGKVYFAAGKVGRKCQKFVPTLRQAKYGLRQAKFCFGHNFQTVTPI